MFIAVSCIRAYCSSNAVSRVNSIWPMLLSCLKASGWQFANPKCHLIRPDSGQIEKRQAAERKPCSATALIIHAHPNHIRFGNRLVFFEEKKMLGCQRSSTFVKG